MSDIDKWCAEQCGVELYSSKEINEHGNYWCFADNDMWMDRDYEWTIQDPRCREIVRERFYITTEAYRGQHKWRCESASFKEGFGKTIAEAEIACITAIYEESDE